MRYEKFRDRFWIFCCREKIEIVHNFFSPPITSCNIDMQRFGTSCQIASQRLRLVRDLAKLKRAGVRRPFRNSVTKLLLRRFAKTGQLSDAPSFACFQQLLDRADVKLIVKGLNLFGAKASQREQFENPRWKFGPQLFQIF